MFEKYREFVNEAHGEYQLCVEQIHNATMGQASSILWSPLESLQQGLNTPSAVLQAAILGLVTPRSSNCT